MTLRATIAALAVVLLLGCPSGSDPVPELSDVPSAETTDVADTEPGPFDSCDGLPPDAACFASRREPTSDAVALAVSIGDKALLTDPTTLKWDWGEAVLMIGLHQLYRVTGDVSYRDHYRAWLDHHIAQGYQITTSDTCAPAALAIALVADGVQDPTYQTLIDDALRYLTEESLRTPEGGLNHHGTVDILGVSLWADSLFMFGNVMTSWGELQGDVGWLDAYAEQLEVFAALMQEGAGFFKHAVYSVFEQEPDVYWGRANGWIAAAAYDHLRVRRIRGETLPGAQASAQWLVDAALATQDAETGRWWTILNRPGETYLETSAGALFAFGMARGWRYGWLGDEVLPAIEAAIEGLRAKIVDGPEGPTVTDVSGPTSVGVFDYYASIPLREDISYGVGAALLALTETSGLPAAEGTQ